MGNSLALEMGCRFAADGHCIGCGWRPRRCLRQASKQRQQQRQRQRPKRWRFVVLWVGRGGVGPR
ncbi:hypothetical protein, partial [Stenotrophomonas lactitubi]|uniref:hypothetical protein n=1 Tax=Stenotrophomonas lactitubi TaxID=2045214 RepID=UPI001E415C83